METVYVIDAVRTPRGEGNVEGSLYGTKPVKILAGCLKELVFRNPFDTGQLGDVHIGCVIPVGVQGGNIAKAAVLRSGFPDSVGGAQINRFGTSSLEALHISSLKLKTGFDSISICGGIEIMSQAKMGSDGGALKNDLDLGMQIPYLPQGVAADLLATLNGLNRADCDAFALSSHQKAKNALDNNYFSKSIFPYKDTNGLVIIGKDEHVRETSLEELAGLHPSFKKIGNQGFEKMAIAKYPDLAGIDYIHTAGNSSGIVDGAAAILLANKKGIQDHKLTPRAVIRHYTSVSSEPTLMLNGGYVAAKKLLQETNLTRDDIDLWEINESFAASALATIKKLALDPEKVNVNGGAIAFGHPLGATGAVLVSTLLDEMERRSLKTGCIAMSADAGLGAALLLELV